MPEQETYRKVALVGGVCSGKTTLLNEYQQKRQGDSRFTFVEEAARSYFRENPRPVYNVPPEEQSIENAKRIQARALENEIRAQESGAQFILTDSSILTAVMYMSGHGQIEKAKRLLGMVEFWLPTYDHFLLLNPEDIPYQTDDIRTESVDHRRRTHEAYLSFFAERQIPNELLCGSLEERVKKIDDVVNRYGIL